MLEREVEMVAITGYPGGADTRIHTGRRGSCFSA